MFYPNICAKMEVPWYRRQLVRINNMRVLSVGRHVRVGRLRLIENLNDLKRYVLSLYICVFINKSTDLIRALDKYTFHRFTYYSV